MLQLFQTLFFVALAIACAFGVLHPRIIDTLLQRIGMVLVFFASLGALNSILHGAPVTERQMLALFYGVVIFVVSTVVQRKRFLDRRHQPRKNHV